MHVVKFMLRIGAVRWNVDTLLDWCGRRMHRGAAILVGYFVATKLIIVVTREHEQGCRDKNRTEHEVVGASEQARQAKGAK